MNEESRKKNYIWLLHIAIWAVLFGMPFFSPRPGQPLHGGVNYARFIPTLVSFIVVFYVNYFLLIRKYLYDRRFGVFILWNVILVAAASILVHLTYRFVYPMPQVPAGMNVPPSPRGPRGPLGFPGPERPRQMLDTMSFITRNTMIYFAIICVAIAVKMTDRWYRDESKRQQLEKASAEAELAALKSQVNPHFLFNTLNNIYSLIPIDQDKAQEAVHDLSGLMRHILYESESPTVSLSSETAFLKDYIKLMGMRCSPDVRIDVNLPEDGTDRQVAPMLFLPLVENAFKHGISPDGESFIKIDLHEEGEYVSCLVENSYHPKDGSDRSGSGIGIKNLCRRLDMLYPGNYSFEHGKVQNVFRCLLKIDTQSPNGMTS